MAAERDSEIDWESELRLSQVDVDDAEDFQLSEVQKEFRFAPPVAVSIVDEYQRSRNGPSHRTLRKGTSRLSYILRILRFNN